MPAEKDAASRVHRPGTRGHVPTITRPFVRGWTTHSTSFVRFVAFAQMLKWYKLPLRTFTRRWRNSAWRGPVTSPVRQALPP